MLRDGDMIQIMIILQNSKHLKTFTYLLHDQFQIFIYELFFLSTTKRRKHADKVGKGLRHFSMKVCEKVRNKGFTSYNEVADELVLEFATGIHGSADSQVYYNMTDISLK